MKTDTKFCCSAVLVLALFAGPASADEAADKMAAEALPHMYHTCASVIEESGGDDTFVMTVVEKLTALSLYNRQIDITQHATTPEQQEALQQAFLGAIGAACQADQNALLGGVVDDAVKSSLGL